ADTSSLFVLWHWPPPVSPLFPYTTLFRSNDEPQGRARHSVRAVSAFDEARRARSDAPCRGDGVPGFKARLFSENNRALNPGTPRSEEHTSELQSRSDLVCRLLLEKKKHNK